MNTAELELNLAFRLTVMRTRATMEAIAQRTKIPSTAISKSFTLGRRVTLSEIRTICTAFKQPYEDIFLLADIFSKNKNIMDAARAYIASTGKGNRELARRKLHEILSTFLHFGV